MLLDRLRYTPLDLVRPRADAFMRTPRSVASRGNPLRLPMPPSHLHPAVHPCTVVRRTRGCADLLPRDGRCASRRYPTSATGHNRGQYMSCVAGRTSCGRCVLRIQIGVHRRASCTGRGGLRHIPSCQCRQIAAPMPDFFRPPAPLSARHPNDGWHCSECGFINRWNRTRCLECGAGHWALTAASGRGVFVSTSRPFALSSAETRGESDCSQIHVACPACSRRSCNRRGSPTAIKTTATARGRFASASKSADILLAPRRASNFGEVM
jgi:hypothetical protein